MQSAHVHSMCMREPWVGDCKLRMLALNLSQIDSTHNGASGCHRMPRGRSESGLEPILMATTDNSISKDRVEVGVGVRVRSLGLGRIIGLE